MMQKILIQIESTEFITSIGLFCKKLV